MFNDIKDKLKGCVAVITGANGGIAQSIAVMLAKHSVHVALLSRDSGVLKRTVRNVERNGSKALPLVLDVSNEKMVNAGIQKVFNIFKRVDFLINCSGVYLEKATLNTSLREWADVISTNLTGTFLCCKAVLPFMIKQKKGIIINFSSFGGKVGLKKKAAYCASKFGVVGFSKALAKELKPYGIKVHIVYPYLVDSKYEIDWLKASDECSIVSADDVAMLITSLLSLPKRVLIEDLEITPYLHS
jgi:NADP-dependent 3-hydroxy acid dehydrogenase YdfG